MNHLAHCPNCRLSFSPNMLTCPYCARVFCHCTHCGSTEFESTSKEHVYICKQCGKEFSYQ